MKNALAMIAFALAGISLHAQDVPSLDGTWRMSILRPGAKDLSFGSVTLQGTSGTWEIFSRTAVQMFENPCIGHVFKLAIETGEPNAFLTFRVHASEVIAGCPDIKVTMQLVRPNKLEGRTGLGAPVTMERD